MFFIQQEIKIESEVKMGSSRIDKYHRLNLRNIWLRKGALKDKETTKTPKQVGYRERLEKFVCR